MGTVPIAFSRVFRGQHDLFGVGDLEPLAPHFYLCKRSITESISPISRSEFSVMIHDLS
jgi:hypothetical protein